MDTTTLQHAQGLVDFINGSPTPYHAVANVKAKLKAGGFQALSERDPWHLQPNAKYVVTRNGSSLIAFTTGPRADSGPGGDSGIPGFAMVGAHTDSPCLKLKPVSKKSAEGFIQVGVEQYGGLIAHTWFDRDLSLAGRVYIKVDGRYEPRLVHIRKPLMRIPTLAIHLNREVNQKFEFNRETEMVPIAGQVLLDNEGEASGLPNACCDDPSLQLSEPQFNAIKHVVARHNDSLMQLVADELQVCVHHIEDFELLLCDHQDATLGGIHDEFIFAPRQDNLTSCYAAAEAIAAASGSWSLISLFDHEEIGSVSAQGADSSFLPDVLRRINAVFGPSASCPTLDESFLTLCSRSFLLSSDQAHGIHPNYERFYEKHNRPQVNAGPVIKVNANQRYATNSKGIVLIKALAELSRVPLQLFVVRNDSPCGSTIGPMLSAKLGVRTLDLGNPQLSMHSIRETGGSHDVCRLVTLFRAYFNNFEVTEPKIRDFD